MLGTVNALPWGASMRSALGLSADIKDSMVFNLGRPVEDAEYPNTVGIQDREAAGGQIFPGRALQFDGADQCAYVADNGDLDINQASTDFVLSGWVKANADGNTEYYFGKLIGGSVDGRYGFTKGTDNIVDFIWQTSTGSSTIVTSIDGDSDTDWHLFTARIDLSGSKIYVYVDEVLQNVGGTAFTGTFATLNNIYEFYIGAGNAAGGSGGTAFSDTQLRDVRIYHKDITSAADLAALQKGEQLGDEVAWWFCEGTDLLEVFDSAGNNATNGYTLTAVNFDSTSFVEGNWQSLMNKYGYAIDVRGADLMDADKGSFENGTDVYTETANNTYSEEIDITAPVGTKIIKCTFVDSNVGVVYYPNNNGELSTLGRKYTLSFWYRAAAVGTLDSLRYSDGTSLGDIVAVGDMIRDNNWHLASVTFTAVGTANTIRFWWSGAGAGQIMSNDGITYLPYYDTAIPPNMRTAVDGVPIEDVLHNPITFAGQAKYPAIARDRSCFLTDGSAYLDMANNITVNLVDDSVIAFRLKRNSFGVTQTVLGRNTTNAFSWIYWTAGDAIQIESNTNGDTTRSDIDLVLDTAWHDYEVRVNNGVITMKLDGNSINVVGSPIADDITFNRVAFAQSLYYFDGEMEYLTITQNSVVTANWQFVEGQGNTVYDVSGNGNHLTGVNVDNNNWGVIDTPTEDYLAEYGGNFARVYNGVDDYHSNPVDDYLISASSGSIKGYVYVPATDRVVVFSSSNEGVDVEYILLQVNARELQFYIYPDGEGLKRVESDDLLTVGWHEVEIISTGAAYDMKVDGVSVPFTMTGDDDGDWFSSNTARENIAMGIIDRLNPIFGLSNIMWVKVDDGVNGDWYYDPAADEFVDRSALGLTMTASGSDTEQRIIPALSDKSADALGQEIQYKQAGANLIPYTYLSMPEDIWELYSADQQERYEGGLMDAGKGTFTLELGEEEVLNNEFLNWTDDDPDDWTVAFTEDASNYITQEGSKARMVVTTNTKVLRQDNVFEDGKRYKVTLKVDDFNGNNLRLSTNSGRIIFNSISSTGIWETYFDAITPDHQVRIIALGGGGSYLYDYINVEEVLNNSDIESWTIYGTNIIENEDNALKITYVDNGAGARTYMRDVGDCNTDLIVGDTYKLVIRTKRNAGNHSVRIWNGSVSSFIPITTEYAYYEKEFVAAGTTTCYFSAADMSAGEILWIDQWELFHKTVQTGNNLIDNGGDYWANGYPCL